MSYTALYRRYRPQTFSEVRGQDHIVTTLRNQIRADRIGHAYLFCGTRGTGKTSVARIFARAVNCEHPVDGSPCGECETCRALESSKGLGTIVEIDAASNSRVDDIREVIGEVTYSPTVGQYKVYIIDEVHMISTSAFNALLKTLEEPPTYCIFILATTDVQKLPVTILSRCQRYDFRRIGADTIEEELRAVTDRENVKAEDRALSYIARAADGAMRDALSLLDQCIAFNYGEELTYDRVLDVLGASDVSVFSRLYECLDRSDVGAALDLVSELVMQGRDMVQLANDFIWYLRNLLLLTASDSAAAAIDLSSDNMEVLKKQASGADMDALIRYIHVFSELSGELKYAAQKRVPLEVALIRLCRPQADETADALTDRVRILEKKSGEEENFIKALKSGYVPAAAAGAGTQDTTSDTQGTKPVLLPEAVPEDIRNIVQSWGSILSRMPMPARGYLKDAVLSMGDEDEDGRAVLFIVLTNQQLVRHFSDPEYKKELAECLRDATGKEVAFEMRYHAPDTPVEDEYADLSGIDFEIEIEDDDPEDIDI